MTIAGNWENKKIGKNTHNPGKLRLVVFLLYHLPGLSFFVHIFLQGVVLVCAVPWKTVWGCKPKILKHFQPLPP